jgi:tape measure domain-containing protein
VGIIDETLRLSDGFSSTFRSFNTLGEEAVRTADHVSSALTDVMSVDGGSTLPALTETNAELAETSTLAGQASESQRRFTAETEKTDVSMKKLLGTVRNLAIVTAGVKFAKDFIGLSDELAGINARINAINDGTQTTADLTNMIYLSAQRARADYAATAASIAQMGANAGNAFASNRELLTFMELINKQFVLSGTNAQSAQSAMLQLSQAMAAGALRGQDLNSILQASPAIARRIEASMGWAEGSIKQYAEKGAVTAEVVKNAMLGSADEINQAFAKMPMTVGQVMTQIKNAVTQEMSGAAEAFSAFTSSDMGQQIIGELVSGFRLLAEVGVMALQAVGQAALWAHDNLDILIPILAGVAAAAALAGASNVAAGLASAAAWAMAHLPIILIGVLLAMIIATAIQMGVTFAQVGQFVGQVFGMVFAVGYNVFATLWNVIASFAEFFANVFVNPVQAVVHLFSNALDAILSMVETVAGAIDALMGSNLSGAVSGFRGKLSGWVDSTFGEQAVEIKRMANLDVAATSQSWGAAGANLGKKLDGLGANLADFSVGFDDLTAGLNLGGGTGGGDVPNVGKVGSVGKVEGDVKLSDEDMKMYRDLAEQRYMNNIELQTLAPSITVNLPEGSGQNLSAEDVAERIRVMLAEQRAAHTAVAHG